MNKIILDSITNHDINLCKKMKLVSKNYNKRINLNNYIVIFDEFDNKLIRYVLKENLYIYHISKQNKNIKINKNNSVIFYKTINIPFIFKDNNCINCKKYICFIKITGNKIPNKILQKLNDKLNQEFYETTAFVENKMNTFKLTYCLSFNVYLTKEWFSFSNIKFEHSFKLSSRSYFKCNSPKYIPKQIMEIIAASPLTIY